MNTDRIYLHHLDTFRLIAMLFVFSSHCYFLNEAPATMHIYNKYMTFSGLGVEFFIMISGFFAAYTYKQASLKDYVNKKIKRLFPVHWICLLIGGYFIGIRSGHIPLLTPLSFTLLQSLTPISGDTNQPCWTISTLLVLYVITPFLIKQLSKFDRKFLITSAFILSLISTTINYMFYDTSKSFVFYFLYVSPYYRIVTYSIGILIGLYIVKSTRIKIKSKLIVTLCELVPLLVIFFMMFGYHKVPGYWYTIPLCLLTLCYSVFYHPGYISSFLSLKVFRKISVVCFCFYLIHFPILQLIDFYISELNICNKTSLLLIYFCSIIVSLVFAYLLHIFIEVPCSRLQIKVSGHK